MKTLLFFLLQIPTETPRAFHDTWEFWLAIVINAVTLIGVAWRASLFVNGKFTEISDQMKKNNDDLCTLDKKHKEMEKRVDKIEENFNHRFTEYKDFVRDLIDEKMTQIMQKLESNTNYSSKKLTEIEKSLAYLKGRQKIEDKDV